ncbi:MAG TPA: nuclear transport factor 2 family protein, partial [Aeromicrobium sp.]|nr:nuclear transport factor 2 family protein [Aeromicrobium sp.]
MADDNSVLAINQAFYDSIESGDMDLMRSIWASRSDVVCVHPGGEPVRGPESVMRAWAMVMANVDYIQFFLTDVKLAIAPGPG